VPKFYFIFLVSPFLFFSQICQAEDYSAQAYGDTPQQARHRALAALSESLRVEVRSQFDASRSSTGDAYAKQIINTYSNLPLLGVKQIVKQKNGEFYSAVYLNEKESIALYRAELEKLFKKISDRQKNLDQLPDTDSQYSTLLALLTDIEQYEKYHTVARLLGDRSVPGVPVPAEKIRAEILKFEKSVPSLDVAAQVLSRNMPDHKYFVLPPLPHGSQQATTLSRLLRDSIRSTVASSDDFTQPYYLKGEYEIMDDGISVFYRAIDKKGSTLATSIVKLSPQAYKGIDYKPASINFSQLLHEGYVISSDFRARLTTNYGDNDLLFIEGQSVELFVKLNNPGYFYIVSHSDNASYLLELNDAPGKRAFVRYVNADEANHWLSLSEFEVAPPFGTENLQLIASNKDLLNSLPSYFYNDATELYEISAASASESVRKTRALKPKRKKAVRSAEATLTLTTMKK